MDKLVINNNALAICLLEIQNDFKFKFLAEENFRNGSEYISEDFTLYPN